MDTGTVYGPPATRNSVPGVVTITCAVFAAAGVAVAGGVVVTSRGGVVAPTAPPGAVGAGATPAGGVAAGGCAPAGVAAGGSGVTSVGTGEVPGGGGKFVGGTPPS